MKFVSKLSKTSLVCSELQVKDYKELMKCLMGDEPDLTIFVETVCDVLSNTTNKPVSFIKSLSVIDILCLLTDVRHNSLGSCNLVITQGDQKFNLELNLEKAKASISTLFEHCAEKILFNNLQVNIKVPSLERLLEEHEESYLPYIDSCAFETMGLFEITTNEQAKRVFDMFPPKLSLNIIKKFTQVLDKLCGVNLLKDYPFISQELFVLPTIEFLIWFSKLLFGENLATFYENIFGLCYSGKMNAQYIETLSVGEYNYFVGLLRQTTSSRNSSNNDDNISDIIDGI